MLFLCQIIGIVTVLYVFCNYDKYIQVASKRHEIQKKNTKLDQVAFFNIYDTVHSLCHYRLVYNK